MGFLDGLFSTGKSTPKNAGTSILVFPKDFETELAALEKTEGVYSLGEFLKRKVEEHIQTNNDYLIGLDNVAVCKISIASRRTLAH